MPGPPLAVLCMDGAQLTRSEALAVRLALPLVHAAAESGHVLQYTPLGLELRALHTSQQHPVRANLDSPVMRRRLSQMSRRDLLARALGLHRHAARPRIIDATAGLGQDALMLAALGCEVTALERSPPIAALLEDALLRAGPGGAAGLIRLVREDAQAYLERLTIAAPLVYLDPMYSERHKSAEGAKELRILRAIVGNDPDASRLLACALGKATERVVVKRARLAEPLDGRPPDIVQTGRSIRYDVYLTHGARG